MRNCFPEDSPMCNAKLESVHLTSPIDPIRLIDRVYFPYQIRICIYTLNYYVLRMYSVLRFLRRCTFLALTLFLLRCVSHRVYERTRLSFFFFSQFKLDRKIPVIWLSDLISTLPILIVGTGFLGAIHLGSWRIAWNCILLKLILFSFFFPLCAWIDSQFIFAVKSSTTAPRWRQLRNRRLRRLPKRWRLLFQEMKFKKTIQMMEKDPRH